MIGYHYQLEGKAHRPGLWKCKDCREQFSVTVGTVFESSKIRLSKWLTAVYLLGSSNKGSSCHQLHRTLRVTYKTAWFMTQRIRRAMDYVSGVLAPSLDDVLRKMLRTAPAPHKKPHKKPRKKSQKKRPIKRAAHGRV